MPALGMAQDTGKLVAWLRQEGERVSEGDPIMEIETDKATVEIEAPAGGILGGVLAQAGEDVPVGQTIAWILAPGESPPDGSTIPGGATISGDEATPLLEKKTPVPVASPVAQKVAAEHGIDLALVKPETGDRIRKADVLAYLEYQQAKGDGARLTPASPKARRLAAERGLDVAQLAGSGPEGAVLAADVLSVSLVSEPAVTTSVEISNIWRVMVERMTQSWTQAPHFYLLREVDASRLVSWRERAQQGKDQKITFTDLLVKLVAAALRRHPRVNATWDGDKILIRKETNVALAIAIEAGLVAPVIHGADGLRLNQIAERRQELIQRAQAGKLHLEDLQDGTFTISNLGMYGVDAFNAIVNPPQAAILAVGRIADRVVALGGQPAVRPTMMMSLSCDHRVIDGARGAEFFRTLVDLVEEPLGLLE